MRQCIRYFRPRDSTLHATNSALLKHYGDDHFFTRFMVVFSLLRGVGLVHEECIAKMRLMSMVDESGQIPYSLIKVTLQIQDDEVEPWVVKAIIAKLVDCKIDQMNQVIRVSRCTERVFGPHKWQALRQKLAVWRGNIYSKCNNNHSSEQGHR